ncbi:NTP transferase domain-containing protein [Pseudoruegeria sp. HB172150]|uniref:nucleotidyltransferase family protein n=1 Tax=Pseudoruegeria sp. HB172150 TaxID=2721164 RepID=UPI0020A6D9A1
MAPLTDRLPKPLVKVAGLALFDHALTLLQQAGISRIAANTHYLADQMSAHLRAKSIVESHEPDLLDTGGGLKAAMPLLGGDSVITLNTDAIWTGPNPVPALLDAWDPDEMDGLLVIVPRNNATAHPGKGDFLIADDGRLTPGPGPVYTGLQIIKTKPFADATAAAFGMYSVWTDMLAAGRLYGVVHTGGWCDVGRPENIPMAEALLEQAHV